MSQKLTKRIEALEANVASIEEHYDQRISRALDRVIELKLAVDRVRDTANDAERKADEANNRASHIERSMR